MTAHAQALSLCKSYTNQREVRIDPFRLVIPSGFFGALSTSRMTRILPEETPNNPRSWEDRQTPPGLRQDPQNKIERNKTAAEEGRPDYVKYTGRVDDMPVGQPVGSKDTTSGRDKDLREDAFAREQYDTVVEGRLGGGEKTVYSAKDGPPVDAQDPTPRS